MDTFEWTTETALSPNNLNEMQNIINDNITDAINETKAELQFIHGTINPTITGDSVTLFTLAQLRTQFNAPSATSTQFFAIVNNGDGSANGKHFENCTWVGNTLYVVMDGTVSNVTTRINYLIFYTP